MNKLFALQGITDPTNLPHANDQNFLQIGMNIAFAIIGAIALLMIVLAGMRLVFARDNAENISKARKTLIHASVGLIIVVSAAAIVNLIIGQLINNT